MATSYPTGLDSFYDPLSTDQMNAGYAPHNAQHANANDAIVALETKVGINSSAVTTTLDYLLKNSSSINPGHIHLASVNYITTSGTNLAVNQLNVVNDVSTIYGTLPSAPANGTKCSVVTLTGQFNVSVGGTDHLWVSGIAGLTAYYMPPGSSLDLVYYAGIWYSLSVSSAPSGAIVDYAGANAPYGWLMCNGQGLSTTQYASLFAVIGYSYGGSGSTFNVPDLRGRVGVGVGAVGTNTQPTYALGATGGEQLHVLQVGEGTVEAHVHLITGTNTAPSYVSGNPAIGNGTAQSNFDTDSAATAAAATGHNTMQPFMAVNKIIKA